MGHLFFSMKISFAGMVTGLYYLRRLAQRCMNTQSLVPDYDSQSQKTWSIFTRRRFRLLVTVCLMLAMKYHQDRHYSNLIWSQVSGFHINLINTIERFILSTLGYHMCIEFPSTVDYHQLSKECHGKCCLSIMPLSSLVGPVSPGFLDPEDQI
jgi:hypothetical protein